MLDNAAVQHSAIPMFFLYGEQQREIGTRFLHVEPLEYRSKPSNWTIRPHAHADLNHVLFITRGGGSMTVDGARFAYAAPCLLVVPAQKVHGFGFAPETAGWVLTIAESYLGELVRREAEFSGLCAQVRCLTLAGTEALETPFERLAQELVWNAPGTAAAIEANLLFILVAVLRLSHHAAQEPPPFAGRALELVARFRALIEARFRGAASLADYANALHVTENQLRRACHEITGQAPISLIHDRMFLEAQRILIYTNMTITEAARYLGFADAAYFTRFFGKRAGQPPRDFRRQPFAASRTA